MIPAGHHLWRLSAGGDRNLGLCCTEEGLFLGRTPLIERRGGAYVVRPRADLDRLFGRAYASEATAARVSSGLAAVAIALGQGNLALAQITAVHLRLPDLRDTVARAALEAEDLSIKRGSAAWDEARHPRTGTPPNPGWFAPNAGAEARSRPTQTAQGGPRRPSAGSDIGPNGGGEAGCVGRPHRAVTPDRPRQLAPNLFRQPKFLAAPRCTRPSRCGDRSRFDQARGRQGHAVRPADRAPRPRSGCPRTSWRSQSGRGSIRLSHRGRRTRPQSQLGRSVDQTTWECGPYNVQAYFK